MGFEPTDPVSQVKSLAVTPIRPLSHLSVKPNPRVRQRPSRYPISRRVLPEYHPRVSPVLGLVESKMAGAFP